MQKIAYLLGRLGSPLLFLPFLAPPPRLRTLVSDYTSPLKGFLCVSRFGEMLLVAASEEPL
jgi:hypothetical protein